MSATTWAQTTVCTSYTFSNGFWSYLNLIVWGCSDVTITHWCSCCSCPVETQNVLFSNVLFTCNTTAIKWLFWLELCSTNVYNLHKYMDCQCQTSKQFLLCKFYLLDRIFFLKITPKQGWIWRENVKKKQPFFLKTKTFCPLIVIHCHYNILFWRL